MRRVIGIDPGYGRCGFAIIEGEGDTWTCLDHGMISTSAHSLFADRLLEIATDLEDILDRYAPQMLSMEEVFFAKNTTTALQVSEVRGMIAYVARKKGIEVRNVKPNEVKLALTGYGRADKTQMQEMVKNVFALPEIPQPDDAADALAVAWTGANKLTF